MEPKYRRVLRGLLPMLLIVVGVVGFGLSVAGIIAHRVHNEPAPKPIYAGYVQDPPRRVYVAGVVWQVIEVDDKISGMYNGLTDCATHRVWAYRDDEERDTVIHELLHAAVCRADGSVDNRGYNSITDEGHEGIYRIAAVWSDIADRNPDLMAWLGHVKVVEEGEGVE